MSDTLVKVLHQWKNEAIEGISSDAAATLLGEAERWMSNAFDAATRNEIAGLVEQGKKDEIIDRFYTRLVFGTGGMRGVMAAGLNRMNEYTVAAASEGLAAYIQSFGSEACARGIAVSYDSRNNSRLFARIAASVFASRGLKVYIFPDLHPIPMLAYALQELGCISGIMVTASHNPPAYNGYKVFWEDGSQVMPPHDEGIIARVNEVRIGNVAYEDYMLLVDSKRITVLDEAMDEKFYAKALSCLTDTDAIQRQQDIPIVFSPIHGTAAKPVMDVFARAGFRNVSIVKEQEQPDGNFPTVKSPNPEERSALAMAISQAQRENAELVVATDPDGDRVGIAVRDLKGDFILLNGNQTAAMLVDYKLASMKRAGTLPSDAAVVSTIVTSGLVEAVAQTHNAAYFETLTGFKYIATKIREFEALKQAGKASHTFIAGGEESYGYLIGNFIRDKDAVTAAVVLGEIAAYTADKGTNMYRYLLDIYRKSGAYHESMVSLSFGGKQGMERMKRIMDHFRGAAAASLGSALGIVKVVDYLEASIVENGNTAALPGFPKSNVLQFFLKDNVKISIRPSGTEPKIKLYFSSWKRIAEDSSDSAAEAALVELSANNEHFQNKLRAIAEAVE